VDSRLATLARSKSISLSAFGFLICPVVLLGGKGVRVSTPFINAFQKKKVWILPKSSTNLNDFKTYFFPPQNVAISKLFFFFPPENVGI
jgi:hypothetical protein